MNTWEIVLNPGVVITVSLLFSFLMGGILQGATLHVDDDNLSSDPEGTRARPFPSIQQAVVASASGDTILVALGKYGPVVTLGKSLSFFGGYPGGTTVDYAAGLPGDFNSPVSWPSATIIEGKRSNGVTFTRFDNAPYHGRIENFTIRKSRKGVVCDTKVSYPHPENITIRRNLIENNGTATVNTPGGGVVVAGDNIKIVENTILRNQGGRGAGIMRESGVGKLKIERNIISDNICYDDHGGGIMVFGEVTLLKNTIARNRIEFDYGWGGGLLMHTVGTLKSRNNVFSDNHAPTYGGAFMLDEGATAQMRGDLVIRNTTTSGYGGGVAVDDGDPGSSHLDMINCTVADQNQGNRDSAFGGNGLFLDDQGQGTSASLLNCIFWGNGDDFFQAGQGTELSMRNGISKKSFAGKKNQTLNPQFVDAANGNYQLQPGSPAINAGLDQPWMENVRDLDGNRRIEGRRVDLGCYETR